MIREILQSWLCPQEGGKVEVKEEADTSRRDAIQVIEDSEEWVSQEGTKWFWEVLDETDSAFKVRVASFTVHRHYQTGEYTYTELYNIDEPAWEFKDTSKGQAIDNNEPFKTEEVEMLGKVEKYAAPVSDANGRVILEEW